MRRSAERSAGGRPFDLAGVPEWAHVVQDGGRGSRLPDPKNWARGLLHGNRPCRVGVRGLGEPAGKHAVLIGEGGFVDEFAGPQPEPSTPTGDLSGLEGLPRVRRCWW